ncbi:hypothetical protein BJI47_23090 [Rhodococcus sp. 1168]|nr:hypothetical protein BJI47_23090 [Rhodococcus sp. 1168]
MTKERFVELVRTESGLEITEFGLSTPFDGVAGWDSMYLLKVITVVEAEIGRPLSVVRAMESKCLDDIYRVATA